MIQLRSYLEAAIQTPYPALHLREAVKKYLDKGVNRQALLVDLEALRAQVSAEEEDVVLEVLDFMSGWSSPGTAL